MTIDKSQVSDEAAERPALLALADRLAEVAEDLQFEEDERAGELWSIRARLIGIHYERRPESQMTELLVLPCPQEVDAKDPTGRGE